MNRNQDSREFCGVYGIVYVESKENRDVLLVESRRRQLSCLDQALL